MSPLQTAIIWMCVTGWVVLQSLWQVFLIWIATSAIVSFLPNRWYNARYWVLMIGLIACPIQLMVTCNHAVTERIYSRSHANAEELFSAGYGITIAPQVSSMANILPAENISPSSDPVGSMPSLLTAWIEHALPWIGILWIFGVVLFSSRLVFGWIGFRKLRRDCRPVSKRLMEDLHRLTSRMQIRRSIEIGQSERVTVPMVVGFLRPIILLPMGISQGMTPAEIEMIVAHELAHIRRYDLWLNAAQVAVESLFFFHPCVWNLSRRIRVYRELCCDELAAQSDSERLTLGHALLKLEIHRGNRAALRLAATDGHLLTRIRSLSSHRETQPSHNLLLSLSALGFVALLITGLTFSIASHAIANDNRGLTTGTEEVSSRTGTQEPNSDPSDDTPPAVPETAPTNTPQAFQSNSENSTNQQTVVVGGKVVDREGRPIRGAVLVLDGLMDGFMYGTNSPSTSTNSKDDGSFQFVTNDSSPSSLPSGRLLWVYASGYNLKTVRFIADSDDKLDCTIDLEPSEDIELQVIGTDGKPCPNAIVEPYYFDIPNGVFYSSRSTGLRSFPPDEVLSHFRVTTNENGKANLVGVPRAKLDSIRCSTDDAPWQQFSLPQSGPLQIRMNTVGVLRGSVRGAQGAEVEGGVVYVVSVNSQNQLCNAKTIWNHEGRFEVKGLMAGNVTIVPRWDATRALQTAYREQAVLQANKVCDVEMVLSQTIRVKGKTVLEATGEAIANAQISIDSGSSRHHTVQSDVNGNFEVNVPPGKYQVHCRKLPRKESYELLYASSPTFEVDTTTQEYTLADLELRQRQLPRLSGKIIDSQGNPLRDRLVAFAEPTFGHVLKSGRSDRDGNLDILVFREVQEIPFPKRLPKSKWVLYPEGRKIGSIDPRDLNPLRVVSENPLLLRTEE
jgi:beta-lactamase regulating signal transducer with metallopeptidase domain/protocatechuate 3,4-dioxygenase beta subunit